MEYLQAVILGIVQGITEFFPVSSAGHLVLMRRLFGMEQSLQSDVFLHAGTLLALIVVMAGDVKRMLVEIFRLIADAFRNLRTAIHADRTGEEVRYLKLMNTNYRKLSVMLLAASLPTAVIGFLLRAMIAERNESLLANGVGMLITAVILLVTDQIQPKNVTPKEIPLRRSFLTGVVQGFSVLPGISRTAMTFSLSILSGLNKKNALRFAYLLSVPAVLGAVLCEAVTIVRAGAVPSSLLPSLVGAVCAFLVGILVLRRIFRLISHRRLTGYAIYSAVIGILLFILYVAVG